MPTEKETYTRRWNDYINGLSGISWNLPNMDDRDELRAIQTRLYDLVEKAAIQEQIERRETL